MKISKVRIENILGIDELEFTPEGFTEISGQNGTGKTSVLEAIKSVVTDGHDATLLRRGSEHGEVVLVLDDGTEMRKRVSDKSSPRTMHREGGKVARPAEAIKALTDMLSVNPIDFLRAPRKDRVRVLLEAMPLQVDLDRVKAISGIPVSASDDVHGLAILDTVRKQVFEDRTGTNRAVREKESTINQLQSAMPEAPEGTVDANEDEVAAKIEEANAAKDAELKRIDDKLAGLQGQSRDRIIAMRDELQAKIDKLKQEAQVEVDAERERMAEIERKAGAQRERTINKHASEVEPMKETLSLARNSRGALAKRQQAMATINTLTDELQDLRDDAEAQTRAIEDIDAYKLELLNNLPIPGVEVKDGEIVRDGIPFDRLNTAQQVDIAVELAKLRAGDLKICCVDGVELLDSEAFEEFKRRASESELQLFVSRVSDGEFDVKTE